MSTGNSSVIHKSINFSIHSNGNTEQRNFHVINCHYFIVFHIRMLDWVHLSPTSWARMLSSVTLPMAPPHHVDLWEVNHYQYNTRSKIIKKLNLNVNVQSQGYPDTKTAVHLGPRSFLFSSGELWQISGFAEDQTSSRKTKVVGSGVFRHQMCSKYSRERRCFEWDVASGFSKYTMFLEMYVMNPSPSPDFKD